MTDEEIEKALEIHYRRGGLPDCETCPYYDEFCHGDCLRAFGKDMQDYINRLKTEIAGLTGALEATKTDNNNLTRTLEECNEELKQIRKETAKEILNEIKKHAKPYYFMERYILTESDFRSLREEYSVEVEG